MEALKYQISSKYRLKMKIDDQIIFFIDRSLV